LKEKEGNHASKQIQELESQVVDMKRKLTKEKQVVTEEKKEIIISMERELQTVTDKLSRKTEVKV